MVQVLLILLKNSVGLFHHGRHAFGICLDLIENDATSKIDDVLIEHSGQPHVTAPHTVRLLLDTTLLHQYAVYSTASQGRLSVYFLL